jgi:ribonuclease VapC
MILDTSAIVAIFFREPGFEPLLDKLAAASDAGIGAPTAAETAIVVGARLRRDAGSLVSRFLHEQGVVVIAFGEDHWRAAAEAYTRFGRGRHRASLSYGDCLTYAVAKLAGQPVLAAGRDFVRTDLEPA